jgi:hypothetical protein
MSELRYKHVKTGGVYEIVCEAKTEGTGTPVIVYRNVSTSEVWTRPKVYFMDGRFQPISPTCAVCGGLTTTHIFRDGSLAGCPACCPRTFIPLSNVGIVFSLDREIVKEETTCRSSISCEWTDGTLGCGAVWSHESPNGISVRAALELAAAEGWILVAQRPVCGLHVQDADGNAIDDLPRMLDHFEIAR